MIEKGNIYTNADKIFVIINDIYIGYTILILNSLIDDYYVNNHSLNIQVKNYYKNKNIQELKEELNFEILYKWNVEYDGYLGKIDEDILKIFCEINEEINDEALVTYEYM